MNIVRQAVAFSRKLTLVSAAFILAVSSLTAAVPFILSTDARAAGTVAVSTWEELRDEVANPTGADHITLTQDITVTANNSYPGAAGRTDMLVIARPVTINGADHTIAINGDASGWQANYVVQVYDTTGVTLNSLRMTGGDAALLVNGSEVTLTGNTHVSGNEFGGIELSRGSGVTRVSSLTIPTGNMYGLWNATESQYNPTLWVDDTEANISTDLLFEATYLSPGSQPVYYKSAEIADVVATNTTTTTNYATLQAAVSAASPNDTIVLVRDATLDTMITLSQPLTIDGQGFTATASYSYTTNGVNNAVLLANAGASGTTIKNITLTNTSTGEKPHGFVAQFAGAISFDTVVFANGRAGVINNGSQVTMHNITTQNNSWYGVNVDRDNATLTISGQNTHTEDKALYVDNRATPGLVINDVDKNYVKYADTAPGKEDADYYVYDDTRPVIGDISPANNGVTGMTIEVPATDNEGLRKVSFVVEGESVSRTLNVLNGATEAVLSADVKTLGLDDGVYSIKTAAEDLAGNYAIAKTVSITIDTKKPTTFSIDSPINDTTVGAEFTIGGAAYDAGSGIEYVEYRVRALSDGFGSDVVSGPAIIPWTNAQYTSATDSWTATVTGLETGYYRIIARGVDYAGNQKTQRIEVYVDKNAPQGTFVYSNDGAPTYQNVLVTLTLDEAVQDITDPDWVRVSDRVFTRVFFENSTGTVQVTDLYGNQATLGYAVTGIDKSVVFGINSVSATTTNPVISGSAVYNVDRSIGVQNRELDIYLDGELIADGVITNADGVWSVQAEVEDDATHEVAVYLHGADPDTDSALVSLTFVTDVPPIVLPEVLTGGNQPNGGLPLTTFGAAVVLGETDDAPTSAEAVQGTSTEEITAQAANITDNTDGTVYGIAWYWWLAMLAALTGIVWAIVALVRGRTTA
tara:strand:+ start:217 stop:2982 length:2766 start_codon:yes stop_codon:yes gene_type:complete